MRESNVIVKVLDLSKLEASAFDFIKKSEKQGNFTSCETMHEWGIVKTQKGLFALCSEGVGPDEPISNDNVLEIDFTGKTNDGGFSIFPIVKITLDEEELKNIPVKEEKNLSQFIRTFGSRLETNFSIWNKTLKEAGIL